MEQLCINFANEKLQRMFTEAVFESVLAEYAKEGINVIGMTFEDNSAVVALIEGSPSGLLTLLAEECFFPNGSDSGWLSKIKEAHRKHANFEGHVKEDRNGFTILHYPGRVTYDSVGFLEKNKDPLSQDVKVLMQYSDDEFVASLFTDKVAAGARAQFKSAKFIGVIDSFRKSLNELVTTLKGTKTHFIRCVKPNEKKLANNFVEDVMRRQLYTSGVVQAVKATRSGFPDHLTFPEILGRFALIVDRHSKDARSGGKQAVASMLQKAKVPEASYRLGKTKVFLGVGVLDQLEQARMEFLALKAVSMQQLARMHIAKMKLKALRAEAARKKREEEEKLKREEEERKKREEEERLKQEEEERKRSEAEAKAREAEEKERQERFRRARQLSFERKTAKKKREEAEKKKAEEEAAAKASEAAAVAAAAEQAAPAERKSASDADVGLTAGAQDQFASKLQTFQQDVADGTAASESEMMNVAVVSDIGWKTGQEPTSEDVWAQYDFKCAVSDVLEYAEYLGMDIKEDAHLLWIADEALQAPEPQGWEQRLDPKGGVYYYHPTTGMSLNQHPLDHHYQQFYMQMKAQYDAMYQGQKGQPPAAGTPGAPPTSEPAEAPMTPTAVTLPATASPSVGSLDGGKKKGLLQKMGLVGTKKPTGPTEEMYQLTVELRRQQDGLGIGLTLDNIIVEVEPGGSVAAQGDLRYGDQIVQVDGIPLHGRMLKDVIVPRKMHNLVVRYSRVSSQLPSPRRNRSRRIEADAGTAPRRIEELDVSITRETNSGRLGFGIDQMNTVPPGRRPHPRPVALAPRPDPPRPLSAAR